MVGYAEVTKVAHGSKRILGGKTLVVVGVVLAAVMVVSRWYPSVVVRPRLVVGLRDGALVVWTLERDHTGFKQVLRGDYSASSGEFRWWSNAGPSALNAGAFSSVLDQIGSLPKHRYTEILLWPPALLALIAGAASWRLGFVARRRWKNAQNVCPACGYARAGLAEATPCPECGRPGGAGDPLAGARGS